MMLTGEAEAALALDFAEITAFSRPPARPRVPFAVSTDEASLWGVAYVLRGSSLGNQVLHPLILRQLGGRHASAFRYLTGSASETRRDWSEFCDRLNQWGARATEMERGRVLACAAATFGLVGRVA